MAAKGLRPEGGLRAVESDAMMESSFRRLLAAIEAEREEIRGSWQQLQEDKEGTAAALEVMRQETEDWCAEEKRRIDAEWKRLDRLSERMADLWPKRFDIVKINCSGDVYEIPRCTLCSIEGSYLAELFNEENSKAIKPDTDGCYYLDINKHCFGLLVEYLMNRRLRVDAPLPVIPRGQQQNMELLAEAWNLKPFLRENRLNNAHGTSLHVSGTTLTSTHPGWQVISALHPLPLANPYQFEVKILKNPASGTSGGLAIGMMGHIPQGAEVHTIRLHDSVMYNSNNGLLSDVMSQEEIGNIQKGIAFTEGSTLGVRHDPATHSLQFIFNGQSIGTAAFREDCLDRMRYLYPVFALYVPEQVIKIEFRVATPFSALQDGLAGS